MAWAAPGRPREVQDGRGRSRTAEAGPGRPIPVQDSRFQSRTADSSPGRPIPVQDGRFQSWTHPGPFLPGRNRLNALLKTPPR